MRRARLLSALLCVLAPAAWAQNVTLQGMLGSRALLLIDGVPKILAVGDNVQGVKLLAATRETADIDIEGKRQTLHLGETQVSVVASAAGTPKRLVISSSGNGHFMVNGSINGQAARFMVDTGASLISIGSADATRMGLNYLEGRPTRTNTANGTSLAWQIKLAQVRIDDIEVSDLDALVTQQPMPYVLLGNNFLNRFRMRRDGEQMTLEKRF